MKYTHPEIETVFDTANGSYNTLVVENQDLLRRLLTDLNDQLHGLSGQAVVSRNNTPVAASKFVELLDCFIPFEVNRKTLLNRVTAALERRASEAEHFKETADLLSAIESYLDELAFSFLCDVEFTAVNISSIIKAAAPKIRIDAPTLAEQVLDFMELITEFNAQKLFVTLNMRSFVNDEDMERFADSAIAHGYDILAIESFEHPKLKNERRVIIDRDLCEIS